ncbi:MAG: biotin--[acetyl-CoA-carboxylase] ligase [Planctomycetia bacterium]|nr:MAG: biotin--[acetyl-CoA-carboxylase] ligase [Planctomycetia bacterium]
MHAPLSNADLAAAGPFSRLRFFHTTPETDSTNRELLQRVGPDADGAVLFAEHQSAGRGRLGRRWVAPRGAAVLLSVRVHVPRDSGLLRLGGVLGAVAAAEAVQQATGLLPSLRWPNDLALHGRKLGGVLAESTPLPPSGAFRALVIGIGLNVYQQRAHFDAELAQKATSLEIESSTPVDRRQVASALVARLDHWLCRAAGSAGGGEELLQAWRGRCAEVGQVATFRSDGREIRGEIREISAEGDLLIQTESGESVRLDAATTTRSW